MARSRLGPLALETKLGSAAAGSSVWRAIHIEQRKNLAVKIFNLPFGGTSEARHEFAREWETLKRLRHPSIARCYGGGFEEHDAYLAYELVDGESLDERIERRSRLPWETVLDEAEALADALNYAHERQIVHGNLTPDKIRLAGLNPMILDFRVDRYGSSYRSTKSPTPFELCFRAPELIEDPQQLSPKADLYSFGAILYYELTGRTPVDGDTVEEVAAAAAFETPAKVGSIAMDCPVWLSTLTEQLLAKDPMSRPHGAAAVRLALAEVRKRAAEGIGVAQHATSGFSALRVDVDKAEAEALLGKVKDDERPSSDDGTAFYERSWFLILMLVLMAAATIWYLQPLSEGELRARAEQLMATGDRTSMGKAKDQYLEKLVRDYPEGEHAQWASEQIELVEMMEAEHQLNLKLSRGGKPSSEGERLYAAARNYEQFGDAATALEKYKALATLLEDEPSQRPFVNLARRQVAQIKAKSGQVGEGQEIVSSKLKEADQLYAQGMVLEARTIWHSVIDLYEGNLEMAPFVTTAQRRLESTEAEGTGRSAATPADSNVPVGPVGNG